MDWRIADIFIFEMCDRLLVVKRRAQINRRLFPLQLCARALGETQLRRELHLTSKSSYSFFRNVGANIVSNGFAPMAWLHPGKSGEFRAR